MPAFHSKPEADEIEVTLMGPGYGESIVIHATNDFWIVIDSCVPSGSRTAAAISYLDEIGINLADVRFIVATHWHDDHVRGLSKVLELSPNAKLVLASALGQKEFMKIVSAFGNTNDAVVPGASELGECFRTIIGRTSTEARPSVTFASAGKVIWDKDVGNAHVKIEILSPSDADTTEAVRKFSDLLPRDREPVNRIPPTYPNHTAMAILVSVGNHSILLGADLETTAMLDSGWNAVLSDESRILTKSSFYKVAHHGSATGHHQGIWNELLENLPLSVMTPFRRGRVNLPKETDRHRIRALSGRSFITTQSSPVFSKTTPEQRRLEKKAYNVQPSIDTYGILRSRIKVGFTGPWSVETFGSADKL